MNNIANPLGYRDGKDRWIYRLYKLLWSSLDWIYPPRCGGCQKNYTRWCLDCAEQTLLVSESICNLCGHPINFNGICQCWINNLRPLTAIRSFAIYEGSIREAILKLKYLGDLGLGEILSRSMIDLLMESNWQIDLIVPVPSRLARQKQRGYNQASLLALPIALRCGIPYRSTAIRKIRESRSQVGLSALERRENVRNTFLACSDMVRGKSVLVVDDIITTGSTIVSCAESVLAQGASQVYGLTLARAALTSQ